MTGIKLNDIDLINSVDVSAEDSVLVLDYETTEAKRVSLSQIAEFYSSASYFVSSGGPEYSIQFNSGSELSGSESLIYDYTTSILSGTTAQFTTISASIISASQIVGIPEDIARKNNNNTFTATNIFTGPVTASSAEITNLTVDVITAREYYTQFITASVIYESGSTKFGDTVDDEHQFSGSINVSGNFYLQNEDLSFNINNSSSVSGTISGIGFTLEESGSGGTAIVHETDTLKFYVKSTSNNFETSDLKFQIGPNSVSASVISASVISASQYVGLPAVIGDVTATGNNTFTGINTFNVNYITASTGITGSIAQFGIVSASVISASQYIGVTSGVTTLDALLDVDTTTVLPTDGQALVWNNTSSLWEPGTITAGGGTATVTGPEYSLQFNSGSQLSGSQNLTWNYNTNNLYITGSLFATTKSFDIVHPTKANMRLRYGSLEGPENGAYVRGKTTEKTVELPDYWTELVDEDTITVNLTPVGSKQDIWVEKIENNTLYIAGDLVECYFTVFGERKDVDKLLVEY